MTATIRPFQCRTGAAAAKWRKRVSDVTETTVYGSAGGINVDDAAALLR